MARGELIATANAVSSDLVRLFSLMSNNIFTILKVHQKRSNKNEQKTFTVSSTLKITSVWHKHSNHQYKRWFFLLYNHFCISVWKVITSVAKISSSFSYQRRFTKSSIFFTWIMCISVAMVFMCVVYKDILMAPDRTLDITSCTYSEGLRALNFTFVSDKYVK